MRGTGVCRERGTAGPPEAAENVRNQEDRDDLDSDPHPVHDRANALLVSPQQILHAEDAEHLCQSQHSQNLEASQGGTAVVAAFLTTVATIADHGDVADR